MIPARECLESEKLDVGPVRLRTARVAADPAQPARGVCVLLNGQTEFIEKYFEVIDELRGRGFAVATLDWRGQAARAGWCRMRRFGCILMTSRTMTPISAPSWTRS